MIALGGLQVKDTYSVAAAQRSYYGQLFPLNPSGIIPEGPTAHDLGLDASANGSAPVAAPDPGQVFFVRAEVMA